ncbi:MAG TPA: MarR family winged helix-turn-helix transcriptional regulator [Draconibacterium sp.]|nr:MarR family winged helix-turn-helix transcriptional regulator [Draconibacterium sp.]
MSFETPLGYVLFKTKRVYSHKLMTKFKENEVDLSLDLYILLFQINANEYVTQQELADHLQKDKSVVMRQINVLIERGFVVRSWDVNDKRKKNLVLTGSGRKKLEEAVEFARSVSDELFAGVSVDEKLVFDNVIQRILENGGLENDSLK